MIQFIPDYDLPRLLQCTKFALKPGGSFISAEVASLDMRNLRPLGSAPVVTLAPGPFGQPLRRKFTDHCGTQV